MIAQIVWRLLTQYACLVATITLRAHGDMRKCSINLVCSPIARTTVTNAVNETDSSPTSMAMAPAERGVRAGSNVRSNARTPDVWVQRPDTRTSGWT